MVKQKDRRGSAFLYIIAALVLLSSVGAGIARLTPEALSQQIIHNKGEQAYYAAFSGLNYAKTLNEVSLLAADSKTYSMGNVEFTVTVGEKSGSQYPVRIIGTSSKDTKYEANFNLGPVDITPVDELVVENPRVPAANFAGAMYNFSGTQFTGDTIFYDADFNGGVTIDGSLSYVGTGTECLILDGNRIGKLDGSSVICSNTCIKLNNISSVYGTVVSQGDIIISRGTIYGDANSGKDISLARWNGYIKKLSGSKGNAELVGVIDNAQNVEGSITYVANKPDACKSYTLPEHKLIKPADNLYYATYTFTGGDISDTTKYHFNNLETNGGGKTCFDLSSPGTYINIFVAGNLNFKSSIYIKTSEEENCFDNSNKITSSNYTSQKFIDAAKRIYIDVNGASTFGGDGHAWVGTIFSKGNIRTEGSFVSVGALYSNASIDTSGGSYSYFIRSDYANKYW